MTLALDSRSFAEAIATADKPILVDFWAEWCQPCKTLSPVLDQIAIEDSRVTVAKVNVDDSPDIARQFGIMSIPTMVMFDKGEPIWQASGSRPKEHLVSELDAIL